MRRRRHAGSLILIIILSAVAAMCFMYCAESCGEHVDAEREYRELEEYYVEEGNAGLLEIDWASLKARYPDIVAWLYLNDSCSYPVVQGGDNEFYLDHSPSGGYSVYGAIFMNSANRADFSNRNTVIYGHNMNNGSMFGSNSDYRDEEYVRGHPYFYIYTPDGLCTLYEIFSVMDVEDATRPYEIFMATDREFAEYITDVSPGREFDLGVQVTSKDSIVSLSTCAKHNTQWRLMIQGVSRGTITELPAGEPEQTLQGLASSSQPGP